MAYSQNGGSRHLFLSSSEAVRAGTPYTSADTPRRRLLSVTTRCTIGTEAMRADVKTSSVRHGGGRGLGPMTTREFPAQGPQFELTTRTMEAGIAAVASMFGRRLDVSRVTVNDVCPSFFPETIVDHVKRTRSCASVLSVYGAVCNFPGRQDCAPVMRGRCHVGGARFLQATIQANRGDCRHPQVASDNYLRGKGSIIAWRCPLARTASGRSTKQGKRLFVLAAGHELAARNSSKNAKQSGIDHLRRWFQPNVNGQGRSRELHAI
jgi:hypothetical protein